MPQRTDVDRVGSAFLASLSAPLACVTRAHVIRREKLTRIEPGSTASRPVSRAPHREGEEWTAQLRFPGSLRARDGGPLGLSLDLQHGYRVVRSRDDIGELVSSRRSSVLTDWRIETTFYEYRILGRMETELLVFHHHPGPGHLGPDHPHVHVSATVIDRAPNGDAIPYALDKRHVATGTVTRVSVVRMLIEEFGAEGRGDWQRILAAVDA